MERNFKNDILDGLSKKYYRTGQIELEYNYKSGKEHGLCKNYDKDGKLKLKYNFKEAKKEGLCISYYSNEKIELEYYYKNDKLDGLCKNYDEDGKLEFENYFKNDKRYFGKDYKYFKENNQEVIKINYYICDNEDNEIIYQKDYQNNSVNLIIRRNYLILNEESICYSKKIINNIKEIQNINDNIKLRLNGDYIKLSEEFYQDIFSYKDIIGKILVQNKQIFFEREFIKEGKLNGLKVLYKKNNGIKEYIDIALYENNIQIEDNIEERKRLINQYLISKEEKEEWINIPFKVNVNYHDENIRRNKTKIEKNNIANNFKETNNKLFYIIIILLLIISGFYFFLKPNNKKQNSVENTTSYSQPQQEEKKTVVENNNINQYIPTVEDARYINYNTYYNDYYDYSMDYPDDDYFQISKTYEDGMRLQNDNGEIIISLTSNWNPNGESLQQAYDKAVREKPNAPYKFLGKTFFTITYEENGILIFRKTMYDKSTNKYVYLYVSFPPEYKDYMTPIVERMANSMKKS